MILQKQHCVQIYFGDTHALPWQCGILCLEYAGLCRFGTKSLWLYI